MERRTRRTARSQRPPPILSLWVIVGAMLIACLLTTVAFSALMLGRSKKAPAQSTAVLSIISAMTMTPTLSNLPGTPMGNPEQPIPSQLPGDILVGAYVQVIGTGGDGLRLRDQPGLNSTIRMIASESEVFKVDDGPVDSDGYRWWHLTGPFDETRQGWAVANFLGIVQNP
jgi:hypothetical protein